MDFFYIHFIDLQSIIYFNDRETNYILQVFGFIYKLKAYAYSI